MNYQGVIFDLDGVICSTDQYHYQAWKALADRLGIYFDPVINNRLRGVSRMESLDIVLEKSSRSYTRAEKEALATEKNDTYRQLLQQMSPADLSGDVAETLETLKSRGIRIAIGSSSKNAPVILERIGLSNAFDAVVDGNSISRSKPDPEVFLKAAQALGLPPEKCLVVEDAHAGVAAALAGGFACAGIGDAAGNPDVTYRLTALSDLLKL